MASELFDILKSINETKVNLYSQADIPEAWGKSYPMFMINKYLSYSEDTINIINEMNFRNSPEHNITTPMHYEFLLHLVPKKKRYVKYQRSFKDELLEPVMKLYKVNYNRAKEIVSLLNDDQIARILKLYEN